MRISDWSSDVCSSDLVLQTSPGTIAPDGADLMAEAGLALAAPTPQVNKVNEGEPGQQAGLRKGDIVVAVGSLDKPSAGAMVAEIRKNAGKALAITVLRDKAPVTLTVTPTEHTQADGSVIGRIGVVLGADFPMVDVRYGLLDSVTRGLTRPADTVWFYLKMMGRLVTGDVSLRNVLGPVTLCGAGRT